MVTTGRFRGMAVVLAVALALGASGCARTSQLLGNAATSCAGRQHQDGPAAPAAQVAVVCRWSAALRAGNLRAAAGYFHLPSVFENETQPVAIHTVAQAELINASFPCGAQVISAFRDGRLINVLFRLTERKGRSAHACGTGTGGTARTAFLIRHGQIVEWLRAPSRAGDPRAPTTGTSQGGGPTI